MAIVHFHCKAILASASTDFEVVPSLESGCLEVHEHLKAQLLHGRFCLERTY